MKRILLLLSVLAFIACSGPQNKMAVIEGIIANAEVEEIELVYMTNMISYDRESHKAGLDDQSAFRLEIQIEKPVMATLLVGKRRMNLWLEPGAQIRVDFDAADMENTLAFSGANAAASELWYGLQRKLGEQYGQRQINEAHRNLQAQEMLDFVQEMQAQRLGFFAEFAGNTKPGEAFTTYFQTWVDYDAYVVLLNYPSYHAYFNQLSDAPALPEHYYDFLQKTLPLDDSKLDVPAYLSFLSGYLGYQSKQLEIPEELQSAERDLFVARQVLNGKSQFFAMANTINFQLNHGEFETAERLYKEFVSESAYADLNATLEKAYQAVQRVLPGNQAPEFTLQNIHGENVSLSDFKGKVVYLDFWASWCGPCMREVPFAKELKKRFEGEDDLVFLYVSVDEDAMAWRNTVERHEIQGVHLNIPGMRHEIGQNYNVKGVPSFFIIDRDGVIHDNNPKRPSMEGIDDQLKAALQK